jgi:hypothetical protein
MQHQQLFKSLFQRSSWDAGNAVMLQDVTQQFPYFGPAYFFLLKETGIGHTSYAAVAGKTALHFNNAYLLNLQLHHEDKPEQKEKAVLVEVQLPASEPIEEKLLTRQMVNPTENNEKTEELIFEPLFASDYFASQGIKLSEANQTNDKLGKQLKSFTEWLKVMKKNNGNKLPENYKMDNVVEKLAEKSNVETEVITETMAEVYLQQGKIDKANEILEKLSLLYPAKSVYFAAKIEQLK